MQFSGVGGQVDFVRGAARSVEGKSIIAFPSTARKGQTSRIVSVLTRGSAVTTTRHDVDYIVTEYGIASMKAKTVKQRMESLINIAHPDFRTEIRNDAYRTYYSF
jgi:4-hydroxybutyrate CoA-transferase